MRPISMPDRPVAAAQHLKIAMILPAMNTGGMEVMVLGLSKELRRRGHEVAIICTEEIGSLDPQIREAAIPVCVVGAPGIRSVFWPRQLAAALRAETFDIVHSHSGIAAKAARAARLAGVPGVVHTLHGVQHPLKPLDLGMVLFGAIMTHINTGVSQDTVAFYRNWLGAASSRVAFVQNGIDIAAFRTRRGANSLRREFGVPENAFVLGTVGRLDPVKNQSFLIHALKELGPHWHLIVVGDGPLRESLRTLASTLGLLDRVHFAGSRRIGVEVYEAFDVFALSSLSEAMPMAVLESFCARVPVVTPRVGGLPALLDDGALGLLYAPGDVSGLAAGVLRSRVETENTRRRVDAAEATVSRQHSTESMATAYEAVYARALSTGGHR